MVRGRDVLLPVVGDFRDLQIALFRNDFRARDVGIGVNPLNDGALWLTSSGFSKMMDLESALLRFKTVGPDFSHCTSEGVKCRR